MTLRTSARRRGPMVLGLLLSALSLAPTAGASRPGAQTQEPMRVTLSQGAAPPDAQVTLPLNVAAPEGSRVGTLTFRVTFQPALLTFVKAERSGLAIGVDATLQADVTKGPPAGVSTLNVTLSTTGDGGSRQPIPVGPVAYLVFKINKEAKPETVIRLEPAANLLTVDAPPKPLTPILAPAVEITVLRPPVTICFFYMH